MTLNYGIFDVSDPQNPDRVYSAALLSRILSKHIRDGIVHGDGGELAVTVTDPPAMTVQVGTGTAMVQGRFCENDAALTLAVPTAHATYPRIDRVVVRLNASPGRVIDILVKKGTPAPSPVPPVLTRTPETWELSLAQVRVEAGATSILSAKITDERGNASLCGVAAPVYVPSSQLEVVGPVDMQGKALTGLPVPSAATDAARRNMGGATLQGLGTPSASTDAATKAYVDGKVAGFGISQIAIDADKNWNGKNITNVGYITATRIRPEASDEVRWTKTGTGDSRQAEITHTVTIPAVYAPGTAKIIANVARFWEGDYGMDGYVRVRVNGVQVYSKVMDGTHEATISIQGGDLVSITARSLVSMSIALSDTAPVVYPGAPTWPE